MTLDSASGDDHPPETVTAVFGQPIVRVTLNRPGQRNPLDRVTVARLAEIVRAVEADPVARVVVIRGAGGHFSAGGDLKGYVELYRRPDEFRRFLEDFHGLLARMEASRRIWVAVIDGYCVAGGLEVLLACDIVVAARSAKIGDAHAGYGQLPGAGGSQRLPRTVGPLRARYLMMSGDILDADEAERIGLVSAVFPDAELDARTERLVARLLDASPLGLAGMKRLVHDGLRMNVDDALKMELDFVVDYATTSSDATEGLAAFQEKRRPRFTGS
jgi:enoyl-CoA hydratase/carnithine racemase